MTDNCTFDDALPKAVTFVKEHFPDATLAGSRFVRDMNGRLFVVVPDNVDLQQLASARVELAGLLGAYSPSVDGGLTRFADTLSGTELLEEPVLLQDVDGTTVRLIERRVVGQDWAQPPEEAEEHPPRVAFFSLKGGVGRSTALFLWGRYLASQGRTVLLVDLDLEAPGLGAQLLPSAERPEYGVIDWLVEDLVSNPYTERMVERMVAQSPLADTAGLHIAPATGLATNRNPADFVAKLARAYLDDGESDGKSGFAARIRRLCGALESYIRPNVVLIDSRAGLHETAAAAILHLDADVLLFATDQPTVWEGYRYLLAQLSLMARVTSRGSGDDWRLRLKMVHAKAGEAQWQLDRYLRHSYDVWLQCLYDEVPAGSTDELFSFSIDDEAGPHYPLTILQDPRFERFNPLEDLSELGEHAIATTFGVFSAALQQRIFGDSDDV